MWSWMAPIHCIFARSRLLSASRMTPLTNFLTSSSNWSGQYGCVRTLATRARSTNFYYEVLGLTPKASQKQIKSAYYALSKVYHPDMNASQEANVKFTEIAEAYEVLGNVNKRRMYDRGLGNASTGPTEEDYTQQYNEAYFRSRQFTSRNAPPTGRTPNFNFDEFYKQHYGDQINNAKAQREWKEHKTRYTAMLEQQRKFMRSLLMTFFIFSLVMYALGKERNYPRRPPPEL